MEEIFAGKCGGGIDDASRICNFGGFIFFKKYLFFLFFYDKLIVSQLIKN